MADLPYAPKNVAHRIRLLREAFGLTQVALASEIGASENQVKQWERGANRPGPDMVYAIKLRYGVPSDWTLYGDNSNLGALGVKLGIYQFNKRNTPKGEDRHH